MSHWFIDAFKALQKKQPRIALVSSNSENSDYTNFAYKNKNCYLVFGGHYNEDVYHSQYPFRNKDCADCDKTTDCELCYECTFGSNLYNCNHLFNCFTCSDCEYSMDLVNCKNCFLSVGLRNVEYHIQNKPVAKERYAEEVKQWKAKHTPEQLLEILDKVRQSVPQINLIQKNCEDCLGSFLENSKGCFYSFYCRDVEDSFYMGTNIDATKDSMDCDNIGYDPSELLYECIGNTGAFNCNFCNTCWHNSNLEYCELVFNSHDCFGCIGRNHAEYEILNEKYSKEDYFKKVTEIKKELKAASLYGKWLFEPTYPYDDTLAALYYPQK